MKTLVIHPKDKTTDFPSVLYSGNHQLALAEGLHGFFTGMTISELSEAEQEKYYAKYYRHLIIGGCCIFEGMPDYQWFACGQQLVKS